MECNLISPEIHSNRHYLHKGMHCLLQQEQHTNWPLDQAGRWFISCPNNGLQQKKVCQQRDPSFFGAKMGATITWARPPASASKKKKLVPPFFISLRQLNCQHGFPCLHFCMTQTKNGLLVSGFNFKPQPPCGGVVPFILFQSTWFYIKFNFPLFSTFHLGGALGFGEWDSATKLCNGNFVRFPECRVVTWAKKKTGTSKLDAVREGCVTKGMDPEVTLERILVTRKFYLDNLEFLT